MTEIQETAGAVPLVSVSKCRETVISGSPTFEGTQADVERLNLDNCRRVLVAVDAKSFPPGSSIVAHGVSDVLIASIDQIVSEPWIFFAECAAMQARRIEADSGRAGKDEFREALLNLHQLAMGMDDENQIGAGAILAETAKFFEGGE